MNQPTTLTWNLIEALIEGLRTNEGSLLLVSHDRSFVSKLATRIVEISPDGLQDFVGSYEDYVEQCGDDHLDSESVRLKVRREKRQEKKARSTSSGQSDRKLRSQ